MSDDLISRQDAIKKCQYRLYESALNNVGYECKADEVFSDIALNRIQTWLEEVPSAQPEIIRCKECKYNPKTPRKYADNDKIAFYIMCGLLEGGEEAFCSNAKRKEE